MKYTELNIEERATIEIGRLQGMSQRQIARQLNRSPLTISRELQRNGLPQGRYTTSAWHGSAGLAAAPGARWYSARNCSIWWSTCCVNVTPRSRFPVS